MVRWFALAALTLALPFLFFPHIDLWVAGLFYEGEGRFLLTTETAVVRWLYQGVDELTPILAGCLGVLTMIGLAPVSRRVLRPSAILLVSLLVGPGLIVNVLLKDQIGRPRPVHIEAFAGQDSYVPPFQQSSQCPKNCSFVSGHAAMGFYLLTLAFIDRRRRILWWVTGAIAGLGLGILRMGMGAHFLSDVLYGFFAVGLGAWLATRLIDRLLRLLD